MKFCIRCKLDGQPFYRNKRNKDGLSSYCKACMIIADKKSYRKHRKTRIAKSKKWQRDNVERNRIVKTAWNRANANSVRATKRNGLAKARVSARARYSKNPEWWRLSHARWRAKHPENEKAVRARRRARKRGARGKASGAAIAARIALFGGMCAYCGVRPYEHLDHVVALITGGTNWPANLRPACAKCNIKKDIQIWSKVKFVSVFDTTELTKEQIKYAA